MTLVGNGNGNNGNGAIDSTSGVGIDKGEVDVDSINKGTINGVSQSLSLGSIVNVGDDSGPTSMG